MGTKLELHDYHPARHARTVASQAPSVVEIPPRGLYAAGLALLTALLLTLILQPLHVSISGRRHVLPRGSTVADAASLIGLRAQPGDLVDVRGHLLRSGAGLAPVFLRNGVVVDPSQRLGSGDRVEIRPGQHAVEPLRETAEITDPVQVSGMAEAAVTGMRRTQVGLLSGKMVLETAAAVPTAPAPGGAGAPKPKLIALTFDDGPYPSQTLPILATLKKHNARATFFVLGSLARAYPDVVRQTVAQGSEIGSHSWNHANLAKLSGSAVAADMARTQTQLQALVGKPVRIMRPPYGALSSTATRALKNAGYRIVLWSVDTNDWRRPGADTIYSRIMNGARSNAIVLCHDGGGSRSGTIAAVARAVPALQARGYELATVSQVLGVETLPKGGALVIGGQRYEVKAIEPGLSLVLDDKPLALSEAPVEVAGQLMVPVKPLLDQLKVKWEWSQQAQKLTLHGAMEALTLRPGSLKIEHQYGAAENLPAPPVLYRGNLMIPLWAVLQSSGATALYDPGKHVLTLISLGQGLSTSGKLGQGPPADWGRHIKWREYLRSPGQ